MNDQEKVRFADWLLKEVIADARGDRETALQIAPAGRYWLGRLAPEAKVIANPMGDRGERLDPCATGMRILLPQMPAAFDVKVSVTGWRKNAPDDWRKLSAATLTLPVALQVGVSADTVGLTELTQALTDAGGNGLRARVDLVIDQTAAGFDVTAELVNCSPEKLQGLDTNLYQCKLEIVGATTRPYVLESLPDSFRYDREVPAYGLNCGVGTRPGVLHTTDVVVVDRSRPNYWGADTSQPNFSFQRLANDPLCAANELVDQLIAWGTQHWSAQTLAQRAAAGNWSPAMLAEATEGAQDFDREVNRIQQGAALLAANQTLLECFKGMNRAIRVSARGRYDSWRPFQFGFLLANLASLVDVGTERDIADVVWFSTGGGKTETYLGLLVTAALYDRSRGKTSGMTAWSRFPLRMLSLQQTQRFADALAAAEIVRRDMDLGGDPFSLGFLVGTDSTPNKVDLKMADDLSMPAKYRVIDRCPFCANASLSMRFDRRAWVLQHFCDALACPSGGALPLYIVDDEVYRFLPTVVVGTLDKAASVAMQASMRGLISAPHACCSRAGHGYTYAPRSTRPNGCLVEGCTAPVEPIRQDASLFAPTFRLQDELHLLRDSLGAIDAHYEGLYDDLQVELGGPRAKIIASSATLAGYEDQVDVLYRRLARVFPAPPPEMGRGFWSRETDVPMRRYVAIAPRGVTVDFAVDRMLTVLQRSIRALVQDPVRVCAAANVPVQLADELVSLYGTDVVYGNTLRDLEAVARSSETQVLVDGELRTASLTGKTGFEEIRQTLARLTVPEPDFADRIHVVTASAMMSHGVDIDRLNVMVMLGLPLATAEFIQATARVGRTHPGLVFVMHKIGRERDAAVFRSFEQFVEQGDRLLEPIPITRHSRRVLERTLPGLAMARILMVHEPAVGKPITTAAKLRELMDDGSYDKKVETDAIVRTLGLQPGVDDALIGDVGRWFERWEENVRSPSPDAKFLSDNAPGGNGPMRSLREVETQVNIWGRRIA